MIDDCDILLTINLNIENASRKKLILYNSSSWKEKYFLQLSEMDRMIPL